MLLIEEGGGTTAIAEPSISLQLFLSSGAFSRLARNLLVLSKVHTDDSFKVVPASGGLQSLRWDVQPSWTSCAGHCALPGGRVRPWLPSETN